MFGENAVMGKVKPKPKHSGGDIALPGDCGTAAVFHPPTGATWRAFVGTGTPRGVRTCLRSRELRRDKAKTAEKAECTGGT
jgi:hypothetical protein